MATRPAVAERRRIDRSRRRISVRYGEEKAQFLGYTQEMGEGGLFLQGNQLYPPGTVLSLAMDLPDGPKSASGIVRWVKEVPPAFRRSMRGGMGIELLTGK
jgi:Tfp pilus assembly protein PilZ